MFIKLPETPDKFSTIIDSREILCFNRIAIEFKNGKKLESCEEWNNVLEKATYNINKIFEKLGMVYEEGNA